MQSVESKFPWSDNTFDAAVMLGVMEFVHDPSALYRRIHAVLRPGAVLALTIPQKIAPPKEQLLNVRTYLVSAQTTALKRAGFEILQEESFHGFEHKSIAVTYVGLVCRCVKKSSAEED